jgi:tetratricopeptide (TPR) repeat protein
MIFTNCSFPVVCKELWIALLVLTAVTLGVYSASFFNGFVMDDEVIIVNNPQTLSLRNVPDVLLAPDLIKPYYRPLNRATYLFDYRVAGMNPAWYHVVNVIIHLGSVLLLFLVCRRLLPDWRGALVAALIFCVHPVNSEAVNFISARNTLLALFFSLASLLSYMDAREKGKSLPVFSALLFFCGLLCKETAFMMIAVIFLATFLPLLDLDVRLLWKKLLLTVSPYLLAAAIYFVMRSYSLQGIVGTSVPAEGLFGRIAQNYHIVPQYLVLLLFPTDLTLFHKVPQGGLFNPPWYLPSMLILLGVIWLIVRSRSRAALFGLAWIVINYAPISNLVPIPSDQLTERYLYMPEVGFFIVIGAFFSWAFSKGRYRRLLWGGTAVIVIVLAVMTVQRNLDWRNNLSLFSSGVRNDPTSPAAHYNLGTAYRENGDLESARKEWEKTLELKPNYADALTQMGTLAAVRGDLGRAEMYYLAALKAPPGETDPDKSMAHLNLGKICEKRGRPREALQHYLQFLKTVPITYLEYKADAEKRIAQLQRLYPEIR